MIPKKIKITFRNIYTSPYIDKTFNWNYIEKNHRVR